MVLPTLATICRTSNSLFLPAKSTSKPALLDQRFWLLPFYRTIGQPWLCLLQHLQEPSADNQPNLPIHLSSKPNTHRRLTDLEIRYAANQALIPMGGSFMSIHQLIRRHFCGTVTSHPIWPQSLIKHNMPLPRIFINLPFDQLDD